MPIHRFSTIQRSIPLLAIRAARCVWLLFTVSVLAANIAPLEARAQTGDVALEWDEAEQVVRRYFKSAWDDNRLNFMTQGHAKIAFQQLAALGWHVENERNILREIPADHDFLIQQLNSPQGQKFLRKLDGEKLLLDRLDRIIQEPGGKRLVQDLIRLPDGYRYAKKKRPKAVPGMTDFLPKNSKGKDRRVKDYDKPTGRIYTLDVFLAVLQEAHEEQSANGGGGQNGGFIFESRIE